MLSVSVGSIGWLINIEKRERSREVDQEEEKEREREEDLSII